MLRPGVSRIAILLAGLSLACSSGQAPPPNVLLVSLDTLRADHLGCYGYARDTSPALDAWAQEGVVFEQAMSTASWTMPAHASLLTGLYPRSHGAVLSSSVLAADTPTLATLLRDRGYATAAVVNLSTVERLAVGFESIALVRHMAAGTAESVVAEALGWLDGLAGDVRFLLFVHFSDAHSDYQPRPEYRERFAEPYTGIADGRGRQLVDARLGRLELEAADARHLVNLYDAGIRQLDAELGRFFAALEQRGRLENTITVVTSDHGEEFLEHGEVLHGHTLHQELVRVPLLLRGPGMPAGVRVREPVSLVDVLPTLAALTAVPAPERVEGRDLRALIGSPGPGASDRALFAEADSWLGQPEGGRLRSVRLGPYTLHHAQHTDRYALYDLREDALEQTDLADRDPGTLAGLRAELERFDADRAGGSRVAPLSDAEAQELRGLGYVE